MLAQFSWDVSQPVGTGTATAPASNTGGPDPLGTGIVRAFRRVPRGDFATDSGIPLVLSDIGQLFGTQIGTLPWRPDFGIDLEPLRHKNNTEVLGEVARVRVDAGLRKWEPRAQLLSLVVTKPKANVLELDMNVLIGGKSRRLRIPV